MTEGRGKGVLEVVGRNVDPSSHEGESPGAGESRLPGTRTGPPRHLGADFLGSIGGVRMCGANDCGQGGNEIVGDHDLGGQFLEVQDLAGA